MPKVVIDTTPIISLLILNKLELLQKLYGEIYIAKAVYSEIEEGKRKRFYKDLLTINWIHIVDVDDTNEGAYKGILDFGEAESIKLAKKINADLILIDEKLGRKIARKEHLKISGTLGVLIKAKSMGLLADMSSILEELSANGVWISEGLKKEVLLRVKEM